jgi:excinuclease ABC subunit C
LLVRVSSGEIPRFSLCRARVDNASLYYGPFVHGSAIKTIYYELRKRYGVLLNDASPTKLPGGKYRLYDDARAEIFPFPNVVSREEYLGRVNRACAFLDGQTRLWKEEVIEKMQAAAEAKRFEEAAKWRDLLQALQRSKNPERKFLRDPLMRKGADKEALRDLQEALRMKEQPASIECFDISHISGSFVVASLVRFDGGRPNKDRYRHFKIRGNEGVAVNDDYAAMREVVGRHYRRLVAEDRGLPQLIVIDGGAGQLKSALAAFLEEGLTPPLMIGLAKREETFVFADGRPQLTLPRSHLGLQLVQRVRDEAHRVANSFNAAWRSRALKSSVIDEIPGIGPMRKKKLLERFTTLVGLKRASPAELAEAVGPAQAQRVTAFLKELQ